MNSMILSFIKNLVKNTASLFEKSGLNKIISGVCNRFASWWCESAIISFLKKEPDGKESLLSKIMNFPVTILEAMNKKIGPWLSEKIENSAILDLARVVMNNVLALNTKFLGCLLLVTMVVKMTSTRTFSLIQVVLSLIGIVLLLINYNITDFLDSSKLVGFCLKTAGFDFKFTNIYKKEYVGVRKGLIIAILLGVISGLLPLRISALMIIGLVGVTAVMSSPVVGVFGALFAAPFVPTMLLAGACLLTTASFMVKAVTDVNFKWRKEGIGIGFFLVLLFISSLFSFAPVKSLMVWGMYFVFAGFFFVMINTVRTSKQATSLLKVFAIAGALVALYGVLQYVFGWNTSNAWIDEEMFEEATMRVYSTMENPNVLGELLLLLIPVAAAFVLKKGGSGWEKIAYAGVFAIACLCMIFTQSRGCWLGLILAFAIFVTFYNGKLWALAPIVLLALPFVIPETMIERMMSVGNLEDSSTSYRVFIWKGTFRMLRDYWIGGIGMGEGAFRSVYPLYSYIGIIAPHSHNTFLQLVVEGGIGVLLVFLCIMVGFFRKISVAFKGYVKNSEESLCALAIGSGVAGFLLQSMFDYTFYNYRMMAMFFMMLAIGVILKACKGEEK